MWVMTSPEGTGLPKRGVVQRKYSKPIVATRKITRKLPGSQKLPGLSVLDLFAGAGKVMLASINLSTTS